MKNPYIVLGVRQDASKKEIIKAKMAAMKRKSKNEESLSLTEIQSAEKQLLDPSKRLAADFLFPVKLKAKRLKPIRTNLRYQKIDWSKLNENAYDSLK